MNIHELAVQSELCTWLQDQIKHLSKVEGEVVRVKDYAGGLAIKFANGNSYTIIIDKQTKVTLD